MGEEYGETLSFTCDIKGGRKWIVSSHEGPLCRVKNWKLLDKSHIRENRCELEETLASLSSKCKKNMSQSIAISINFIVKGYINYNNT